MYMLQSRNLLTDLAPRFSGLIIVITLHIAAVVALMAGLTPKDKVIKIEDLTVKTLDEPRELLDPPPPRSVEFVAKLPEIPQPREFLVEQTQTSNGITETVAQVASLPVAATVAVTAAKSPSKGLSAPAYPSEAKKLGEEGAVGLALYLTGEGRVQNARVETSSGFSRLDQAAVQHALKSWKFEPCTEQGKTVPCWHKVKFRFQLKDA